jgi:hypothetical protein
MTAQLKDDLKTIFGVLFTLLIYAGVSDFLNISPYIYFTYFGIGIVFYLYYYFTIRKRKDSVIFPTQNDNSSKMGLVAFGIIVIFLSVTSYYGYNNKDIYSIIGFPVGIIMILLGLYEPEKGFITINKNLLKIIGVANELDIRQLKEITLKNDKIILTNIYDENTISHHLKLNVKSSEKIIAFLEKQLNPNNINLINQVSNID